MSDIEVIDVIETTDRPRAPESFAYVRVRVADLDTSIAYYERYVGLDLSARTENAAYLRAGIGHHAVALVHDPTVTEAVTEAIGYTMANPEDLAAIEQRITDAGYEVRPLADSAKPFVMGGIGVEDMNGLVWEFVDGFHEFAEPPFLAFHPERVMHPFLVTPLYEATLKFATEVLGFIPSDYIADITAFCRGEDRYHHALAILKAEKFGIDHINFLMSSFDLVMRGRARIMYEGVPVKMDLVKHSASTTIAFYFHDPVHGPPLELSYGHRRFTPEEHLTHRARRLAEGARNELDVWRSSDDDWREAGG